MSLPPPRATFIQSPSAPPLCPPGDMGRAGTHRAWHCLSSTHPAAGSLPCPSHWLPAASSSGFSSAAPCAPHNPLSQDIPSFPPYPGWGACICPALGRSRQPKAVPPKLFPPFGGSPSAQLDWILWKDMQRSERCGSRGKAEPLTWAGCFGGRLCSVLTPSLFVPQSFPFPDPSSENGPWLRVPHGHEQRQRGQRLRERPSAFPGPAERVSLLLPVPPHPLSPEPHRGLRGLRGRGSSSPCSRQAGGARAQGRFTGPEEAAHPPVRL